MTITLSPSLVLRVLEKAHAAALGVGNARKAKLLRIGIKRLRVKTWEVS